MSYEEKTDSALHAGATFTITVATYAALRGAGYKKTESIFAAGFTAIFVGAVKEIIDKKITEGDLEADLTGTTAAMFSIAVFHF